MRITRKVVEAKVDNVNRLLGFDPDTDRYQVGMLMIQGAYDGHRVERITSEGRSVSPIGSHAFGPLRDCAMILDGFRECLLIQQHDRLQREYVGEGQYVARNGGAASEQPRIVVHDPEDEWTGTYTYASRDTFEAKAANLAGWTDWPNKP